ncbi:MAG: hypothetical protein V1728_04590 [Candidatus Micrarchaeota archaeon]
MEVALEFDDIRLLCLSAFGVLECQKKVVVAGNFLEQMVIGLHGNADAPKPIGVISETTVVVVVVAEVGVEPVVVAEVVVVAGDGRASHSPSMQRLPLRLHGLGF